jgi:hypothetical protein
MADQLSLRNGWLGLQASVLKKSFHCSDLRKLLLINGCWSTADPNASFLSGTNQVEISILLMAGFMIFFTRMGDLTGKKK